MVQQSVTTSGYSYIILLRILINPLFQTNPTQKLSHAQTTTTYFWLWTRRDAIIPWRGSAWEKQPIRKKMRKMLYFLQYENRTEREVHVRLAVIWVVVVVVVVFIRFHKLSWLFGGETWVMQGLNKYIYLAFTGEKCEFERNVMEIVIFIRFHPVLFHLHGHIHTYPCRYML